MRLVDIAALMYISIGLADVLDVMSTATRIALHFRYSASRGYTKCLLVRISISVCWVDLSRYGRLLAVFIDRSTIAVRDWGSRTGHSSVV